MSEKTIRSGVFVARDGTRLFVPTPEMWQFRKAARPREILQRAGFKNEDRWHLWRRTYGDDHWVLDWLRNRRRPPEDARILERSQHRRLRRRAKLDGEIWTDDAMMAFRRESTVAAISRAASVHASAFYQWQKRHPDPWFEPWIFGTDADGVTVATEADVRRARFAWDYWQMLGAIGVDETLYYRWFDLFPADAVRDWALWLFGGEVPAGWFVIPRRLVDLRRRLGLQGVAEAAGIPSATVHDWRRDADKRAALEDAIRFANSKGRPRRALEWQRLASTSHPATARMLEAMTRYADATKITSACSDVGMAANTWGGDRRAARSLGLDRELVGFVESPIESREPKTGVVAERLFLPLQSMVDFRTLAMRRRRESQLCVTEKAVDADCFEQWRFDWILPERLRRIRSVLIRPAAPEPTVLKLCRAAIATHGPEIGANELQRASGADRRSALAAHKFLKWTGELVDPPSREERVRRAIDELGPSASLREYASRAGMSPTTVSPIRNRLLGR